MKVNGDKSHLFMFRSYCKYSNQKIYVSEDIRELLGTTIDSRLTFENYINKLCKKASQKLNALARISNYMTFDKRKIIMKAFITSQVSYCLLVWMLHRKRLGKKSKCIT